MCVCGVGTVEEGEVAGGRPGTLGQLLPVLTARAGVCVTLENQVTWPRNFCSLLSRQSSDPGSTKREQSGPGCSPQAFLLTPQG